MSFLLFLSVASQRSSKEEGSLFHEAFYPANVCEEQAGLAHSIQKSLPFPRYFFFTVSSSGPLASTADDSVCRAAVLLCGRAHRGSGSARSLGALQQTSSVPLCHFWSCSSTRETARTLGLRLFQRWVWNIR